MTRDERRLMLESFGRGPALLCAALRPLPKKMWLYQPSPGRWSIHEMILHLTDREVNSYFSFRRFIAEPHREFTGFDAAQWAGSLGYFHQSTREAIENFQFRGWSASGLSGMARTRRALHVTEVAASPDSRYSFDVVAGRRRVICFSFDTLDEATAAARDMRMLLPSVSSVLQRPMKKPPASIWPSYIALD